MFDDLRAVTLNPSDRKKILTARKRMKLRQSDVAAAARVSQQAIAQIESGESHPKFCVLDRICTRLELTLKVEQIVEIKAAIATTTQPTKD